jgi:hypothetical protein
VLDIARKVTLTRIGRHNDAQEGVISEQHQGKPGSKHDK